MQHQLASENRDSATESKAPLENHPGFGRMFTPGRLTVGLFLPLWPYTGDMNDMRGQGEIIERVDHSDFASLWVRDVPLADPRFGDVGQVYDPWTYLAWIAARTQHISLSAGSAIFTLRHPIDVAKQAASIDHLSGGRLVLGAASGDRVSEFPAYGIEHDSRGERYREAVEWFRSLTETTRPELDGALGRLSGGVDLEPKAAARRIPLLVTGSSQQSPEWIADKADGWLIYPGSTHSTAGTNVLKQKVETWRELIANNQFKPVITNEWIDLTEHASSTPMPTRSGFVLRTGTQGLLDLLGRWQDAGINHGALGIQHGSRPAAEVVQQLIEEVAPHFPAIASTSPLPSSW